jgi:hypothetical protein
VLKDYIQNVEDVIQQDSPNGVNIYFLNDVHYYLAEWTPKYTGTMYISGGLFSAIPGYQIRLPFGQGVYDNIPQVQSGYAEFSPLYIYMTPKGSGNTYEHPNVEISYTDKYIDYGWFKQFNVVMCSSDFWVRKVMVPSSLTVVGNAQATYLRNLKEDAKLQTKAKHLFENNQDLELRIPEFVSLSAISTL